MNLPNQQGQTLIEVLIAIAVLFVGMLGVLGLAQANVNNEILGADRLVATQLSREAIEVIRATRDSNYMQTTKVPTPTTLNDWDQGIGVDLTKNGPTCGTLNTDTLSFSSDCSVDIFSSQYQLKKDPTTGIYNLSTGTPTKFYRKISTRPICLEGTTEVIKDECYALSDRIGIEVRAEVSWLHYNAKKRSVLVERLYNWR